MAERSPQVPRPRIQELSDLIFGLALSIGAIQFVSNVPALPSDLTTDLFEFGFSFLILINVWNRYTTTMSVMPAETPMVVRLNMILLFLVAIEPFLFDVLFVQGFSKDVGLLASVYYGLDLGGMNLILAFFTHMLASEEKNLIPRELNQKYTVIRNLLVIGAAVFLASALPPFATVAFDGLPIRVIMWLLTLPIVWINGLFGNRYW